MNYGMAKDNDSLIEQKEKKGLLMKKKDHENGDPNPVWFWV